LLSIYDTILIGFIGFYVVSETEKKKKTFIVFSFIIIVVVATERK